MDRKAMITCKAILFGAIAVMMFNAGPAFAVEPFTLSSPAFRDGDVWPAKFAGADPQRTNPPCPGQNVSPPVAVGQWKESAKASVNRVVCHGLPQTDCWVKMERAKGFEPSTLTLAT